MSAKAARIFEILSESVILSENGIRPVAFDRSHSPSNSAEKCIYGPNTLSLDIGTQIHAVGQKDRIPTSCIASEPILSRLANDFCDHSTVFYAVNASITMRHSLLVNGPLNLCNHSLLMLTSQSFQPGKKEISTLPKMPA